MYKFDPDKTATVKIDKGTKGEGKRLRRVTSTVEISANRLGPMRAIKIGADHRPVELAPRKDLPDHWTFEYSQD